MCSAFWSVAHCIPHVWRFCYYFDVLSLTVLFFMTVAAAMRNHGELSRSIDRVSESGCSAFWSVALLSHVLRLLVGYT